MTNEINNIVDLFREYETVFGNKVYSAWLEVKENLTHPISLGEMQGLLYAKLNSEGKK